jgi:hypothetical protein
MSIFFTDTIRDITNSPKFCVCWSNARKYAWDLAFDIKKQSQLLTSIRRPLYVVVSVMLIIGIVEVQASTQTQE